MNNEIFIAIIFFISGSIACHLYKRHIIRDLEAGVEAWRMQAHIAAERFHNWRCLRPHLGDINSMQQEVEDATGLKLDDLINTLERQVKDAKETFGI